MGQPISVDSRGSSTSEPQNDSALASDLDTNSRSEVLIFPKLFARTPAPPSFVRFPKLPPELRAMIWDFAFDHYDTSSKPFFEIRSPETLNIIQIQLSPDIFAAQPCSLLSVNIEARTWASKKHNGYICVCQSQKLFWQTISDQKWYYAWFEKDFLPEGQRTSASQRCRACPVRSNTTPGECCFRKIYLPKEHTFFLNLDVPLFNLNQWSWTSNIRQLAIHASLRRQKCPPLTMKAMLDRFPNLKKLSFCVSDHLPTSRVDSIRDERAMSFLVVFGGWASPGEWWQSRGIDMEVLDLRKAFNIDTTHSNTGVNVSLLERHFNEMRLQ
ncbi:hypothetical protein BDZ45DRAFT_733793 [Acephala macrosclerotiorum]|nr:hypothetical protein BDZ45DRAFT_733793 [Acephala macrosclerotiorum]